MAEEDILLDIPDGDLPELLEMYEKHKQLARHAYSTITNGIEFRKKTKGRYMTFMSPNGCWREDGTFFVVLQNYSFDIFLYSLDDSGKNIYEGITKTKRFDPAYYKDRIPVLFCVQQKFRPTILRALEKNGRRIPDEIICNLFSIPREEALKLEVQCPDEVYIKKLDATNAPLIDSVWPHRYKDSVKFIGFSIETIGGYGLFLRSTDELVSWMVVSMMGQLASVQTLDTQRKKGYASVVVKHVSKEIALRGHSPCATVLDVNVAARNMFEKIGFRSLGGAAYTLFE